MLRFAPSPTKDMDISNLRAAIFNYIVSKQLNENLVIRIEDTNKDKNIEGKDKEILEILSLFSIEYSYAVHQSDSLKYHQKMAMQLLTQKKAFSCFCGDEKLKELEEEAKKKNESFKYDGFCETLSDEAVLEVNAPFTVRIKKPEDDIQFNDLLKGDLKSTADDIDSFIILRHDKTPTYNYACAIDDMLMDISLVIRTQDHLFDTPKQIHIRNSLGYTKEVKYVHLPTIQSDNEISVKSLIDEGFLPSAIANYLVLLGNETPTEIFTLEEAITWFKIEDISKNESKFDIEKLKFINKKHLEIMDDMRLSKILGFADSDIGKLAKIYLEEANTINDIKSKLEAVFASKTVCEGFENEFLTLKECLVKAPYFDDFNELTKYLTTQTTLRDDTLDKTLRYALTGATNGPKLSDIYPLIKNYLGEIIK
ncbi:glutamate--tRNA ligase [Poseidonibacter sp.]|uniref:glutamate--tRNA ligase n=1 Tax=Poseidonibacter sp. TaxID=2321188 RepID=UPI003C78A8DD